jgi:RNA polymerase sigma factor (TIGR02999 family)
VTEPSPESSRSTPALVDLLYNELHSLAQSKFKNESGHQTLQATALVHEAYLRLASGGTSVWESRAHFFSVAAEAMRRILVENARRKLTQKRGARPQILPLDEDSIADSMTSDRVLAVSEALDKLSSVDPQKAELVKMRYFVGLTLKEAAEALSISEPTAKRHWAYARAWLYRSINQSDRSQ